VSSPAGQTQALFILTKYHSQRFEFIFTNLASSTGALLNVVQAVHKAYDNSRLYRELKLRGENIDAWGAHAACRADTQKTYALLAQVP
jgi:hypothetical protein